MLTKPSFFARSKLFIGRYEEWRRGQTGPLGGTRVNGWLPGHWVTRSVRPFQRDMLLTLHSTGWQAAGLPGYRHRATLGLLVDTPGDIQDSIKLALSCLTP